MVQFGAHAATDITGFGILGHAYEMATAAGVTITIVAGSLPVLPQAIELLAEGMIPGGANDNRKYVEPHVRIESSVDKRLEPLLFDPQTSGGLFIAIAPERAAEFEKALRAAGIASTPVGTAQAFSERAIRVI
jgi:selenide,water dikinase